LFHIKYNIIIDTAVKIGVVFKPRSGSMRHAMFYRDSANI